MHCVDLGESFLTCIYLQNLASIQPRTSALKFARSFRGAAASRSRTRRPAPRRTRRASPGWPRTSTSRRRSRPSSACRSLEISEIGNSVLQNSAICWRARSRLYQNEILQENMRLTAFFKLYKMCALLHRSTLEKIVKNQQC